MNDINRMLRQQVKMLRADARRIETVAKHLRAQAKEIVKQMKAESNAEKKSAGFFAKQSSVDKNLTLNPNAPDFIESEVNDNESK